MSLREIGEVSQRHRLARSAIAVDQCQHRPAAEDEEPGNGRSESITYRGVAPHLFDQTGIGIQGNPDQHEQERKADAQETQQGVAIDLARHVEAPFLTSPPSGGPVFREG